MIVTTCRMCESSKLELIIDLGFHPLADTFLYKNQLVDGESAYPLQVLLCQECGHAMTSVIVPAEKRYQEHDYSYDSSNSRVSIEHFREMASQVVDKVKVNKDDLIVDIGSNVGTLLSHFKQIANVRILGVEPAHNIAGIAQKNGIPTVNYFFCEDVVGTILKQGRAKVVTCTNVLNHVDDLVGFIHGLDKVLTADGYFVFEVPYLLDLVRQTAFDTIYLEHINYFAVTPMVRFFKRFGFSVQYIERQEYMGGSIRVYIRRGGEEPSQIDEFISMEHDAQLFAAETYAKFMSRVRKFKFRLNSQLYQIKCRGGRIVGIGAATKGNTLLNYCKIDSDLIEFVTDSSQLKIGKVTPGAHLPICGDGEITNSITHALILPWNIAAMLKEKLKSLPLEFLTPQMEVQ